MSYDEGCSGCRQEEDMVGSLYNDSALLTLLKYTLTGDMEGGLQLNWDTT